MLGWEIQEVVEKMLCERQMGLQKVLCKTTMAADGLLLEGT